nr:hypothetical protein [Corynebacterium macginleyi]
MKNGHIPGRLTPYGLRHVAAGLMLVSSASMKAVQKQLGHKSAMPTLDTYADLVVVTLMRWRAGWMMGFVEYRGARACQVVCVWG